MKWFSKLFGTRDSKNKIYLPSDFCEGKSDEELFEILKNRTVSVGSGNMIVLELLERLLERIKKK